MTFPIWWQSHFFQPCSSHHQPVNHHSPTFYHNFWLFGIGDVGYLRIQTTNVRSRACTEPTLAWQCRAIGRGSSSKISVFLRFWLVVDLPLWKIWLRQLGLWHSQLNGKIKVMFQTTNQLDFIICYLKLSKIDTDSNIGNRPSNKSTASLEDRIWIFGVDGEIFTVSNRWEKGEEQETGFSQHFWSPVAGNSGFFPQPSLRKIASSFQSAIFWVPPEGTSPYLRK